MGDQFIKVFVTTEGLEYLDQALKEGRGILLMAPHIGNPHIGFYVLRLMGYEITIIKGGKPRLFPTGTLHLACEANAIVFPFSHLYRRGKIQLIFKERMDEGWIHGEGGYRRIIEAFTTLLESYIHKYPEEYMGFYGDTVVNHYYRSHRSPLLREGET